MSCPRAQGGHTTHRVAEMLHLANNHKQEQEFGFERRKKEKKSR